MGRLERGSEMEMGWGQTAVLEVQFAEPARMVSRAVGCIVSLQTNPRKSTTDDRGEIVGGGLAQSLSELLRVSGGVEWRLLVLHEVVGLEPQEAGVQGQERSGRVSTKPRRGVSSCLWRLSLANPAHIHST